MNNIPPITEIYMIKVTLNMDRYVFGGDNFLVYANFVPLK